MDYNQIIDKYAKKYHIDVTDPYRDYVISFYIRFLSKSNVTFEYIIRELLLKEACNLSYPGLNLYEACFSKIAQN